MLKKLKQFVMYVLYILFSSAAYGVILYLVYTWLAGFSLLYAYLGNLALIIFALVSDNITFNVYDSAMQSKKNTEVFKNSRFIRFHLDSFISYKTTLYMFYIFILLFSQVINSEIMIINESLRNFITANEYSILLLIAVDLLIRQFSEDREKSRYYKKRVENYLADEDE